MREGAVVTCVAYSPPLQTGGLYIVTALTVDLQQPCIRVRKSGEPVGARIWDTDWWAWRFREYMPNIDGRS